jgi:hypothetical protein
VNHEVLAACLVSSGLRWHDDGIVTMLARIIHASAISGVETSSALPPSFPLSMSRLHLKALISARIYTTVNDLIHLFGLEPLRDTSSVPAS